MGAADRTRFRDVNKLTPAELKMLEAYAEDPCLPAVARKLGVTASCVQIRGKSIREKLDVTSLEDAVEKVKWLNG